eukprot:TRINITY_DN330_c0_g1_i2.p8 TRINITY_DN330_c0_g1~~TRINITY_DN330_c0_g1_i2.p8  ORF type:complete len:100 (+),score=21.95 TRINITY_DN330_c0_g1_i2:35-301(+)
MSLTKFIIALLLVLAAVAVAKKCPKDCKDVVPPMGPKQLKFTCAQQQKFGQCDADFMEGYCKCSCGTCDKMMDMDMDSMMMLTTPKLE